MKFDPSSAQPVEQFDPTTAVPEEAPPVRAVLSTAVKQKPDQVARAAALGKQYGMPTDTVSRRLQDVEYLAAVDLIEQQLAGSPKLASAIRTRPDIAPLTHDSIEPLAKIESNFAKVAAASAGQAVLGISEGIWRTPDAAQRAVGYLASQVERTGLPPMLNPIRGVQDVLRFVSEGRVPAVGSMGGTTQIAEKVNDAQKILTDKETFGSAFADVQTLAQNADKALATAVKTGNLQQAAQVLTDPNYWSAFMSQAIPSLYLAMKSGGSTAFMAWMEGMEQAGNAAEFEKKTGIKISDAEFTQAVAQTALVNALLEKYGLDKVLGAKGGGVKGIAKAVFAEGGTEGLQQVNSNLSALLAYNPEQSLSEGVMASVMGGMGSGGGMAAAQTAAEQLQAIADRRQQQADAANTNSDQLAEQLKTAGAAALRERSPEQFRALMGEMTDGKIYVDGEVLNQLPEDVKASLPQSVQDQIATAAATGDVVEISTADALTVAPGTALEEVLVEHARTDPFAMSKADAAEAAKLAQSSVMADAQRVIQQAQDTEARQAEYNAIHKLYADQLNAAARFRPAVNEAKAHWLASFYTTMAARTGMTPAQFQAAHPVRILGQATRSDQPVMDTAQLDQGKPGAITVEGYHFSKEDRPVISTAMFGTGLQGSSRDEYLNAADKRLSKRTYFYADKGTGIRPESGVGGRAHRVNLTNVYDSNADPLGLKKGEGGKLGFESRVLDAGFSGYLDRLEGTQPGQVIMLGEQTFRPELLGPQSRIETGVRVPAMPRTEPKWETYATGTPADMQVQMERMQAKSSWQAYDMRVEGGALQYRKKATSDTLNQEDNDGQAGNRGGRYSSGSLAPLEGAPNVAGAAGPDPRLVAVAERYAADNGIALRRQAAYAVVDPERAARIAAAYEAMEHAPNDPAVREAYDNLAQQTLAQYLALQQAGYQFYLVDETNDPYAGNPWNAMRDLRANQTMGVFATEAGFGTSEFDPAGNPLLADTGIEWGYGSVDGPKKRVLFNDLFRAVHDAFGHGLEGAGFRAQGEENAWQAHVRLFTGSAVGAITSETRGQNSWLNYGPHGEKNHTAKVEDTVFADQKTGLMPEWTWTEGRVEDEPAMEYPLAPPGERYEETNIRPTMMSPDEFLSRVRPLEIDDASRDNIDDLKAHILAGRKLDPLRIRADGKEDGRHRAVAARELGITQVPVIDEQQVLGTFDGTDPNILRQQVAAPEGVLTDDNGKPLVLYHGTAADISKFKDQPTFFAADPAMASMYAEGFGDEKGRPGANVIPVYLTLRKPKVVDFLAPNTPGWYAKKRRTLMNQGYDGMIVGGNVYIAFDPKQIVSAISGEVLGQQPQQPRGTFNPATLELVLNPNANLSTFFHETGHFFLEVLADIASQPNAPAQIVEDFNTFLKWAGVADAATWNAMTLDQKRGAHERWAESIEQYVMEGKAPSVELQPLMRRFASWLKSVYGSIKAFLASRGVQTGQGGGALNQMPAPEGVLTDENGKPLVLYHGTAAAIEKFDPARAGRNYPTSGARKGIFFTTSPVTAEVYAEAAAAPWRTRDGAPNTVPAYLTMVNPLVITTKKSPDKFFDSNQDSIYARAEKKGSDGVIIKGGAEFGRDLYVVFDPKQIVSAISGEVLGQDPNAQPGPPMALNDDIRRVMDRLLATDEQIAQANEVAGLVPDEAADAAAAERLAKRSVADLKWSVRARDQVIAKLRKQAAAIEKDIREQVTVEVDQTPEMRAKRALDALTVSPEYAGMLAEHKAARKAAETTVRDEVKVALLATNPEAKGLVKGQLLMKNKRDIDNKVDAAMIKWDQANPTPRRPVNAADADVATIADSFGFESVDAMMQAIDAFGSRREAIDGLTERRMLEEHGDLIDERAISEAANEAVHNEARARSLATELRTQREMLNPRADTGEVNAKGSKITVNALVEAAKQFAANVVSKTTLRDLTARAWQHTAAERRAAKRWQDATAAGKTEEAVKAKQDQMLNHAAAKAAIDAKAEATRILDFFKRVTKGNDETVVEKGRDPDIVNAARAALAAYGVQGPATKNAADYLEALSRNDPETYNVILPMVEGATRNAQPLDALTFEELQALDEDIQAMWFLAKRSRQMEVDGDLLDVQEVADEVYARLEEIGIPDTIPGETGAMTNAEIQARRWLQQVPALLRRVEQWAEAKDGKFGGPFSRFIFGPVKAAADKYRTDRLEYRKKFQALVDNIAPMMPARAIAAPELNYTFGRGHNGIGMAELLHAIAHTGNESNKRKLLLGRGWATDNGDGTIDTSKWDAFIGRLAADGTLQREHFDFVQGVWDLMEQTKPLAQVTHRAVFGRYFAEVTADAFVDPFGVARSGGYIPAQADPLLVQDADLRELLETDNAGMSQAFPATNKGFTKSRVEYNRPLKLDLRTLPQHIDKVLLFSHMEPAVRGVARLLRQPKVSQPLSRVDPAAIGGMLKPWLNRSARQTVETPVSADAGLNRVLSTTRARVGMALMFANVSNTLQQITGFFSAATKVKPSLMRRATAQFIASPKRFRDAVWTLSPYMADRASNEVSVLSDTMEKILINPGVFARAESWTRQHAYFMQTAFDNVMSPIIWTGAYNQGIAEGMDERMAVRYADGVIRQTQGSTLPEDVSRIETGPAYARVFTQFIGYFNMLANTNATALQQIAQEQGLKKGAGKAFGVVMLGLLAPIWVAEAIAHAMRGGPEDEDDDGYLDDWLAAVFGFGTIRGILAGVPFVGAAAQSAVNRFNDQPADDKFSLSPTVSVLESAVGAPASVYGAIVDDKNAQKAVRDVSALITVATGLPAMAAARPIGYLAGVAQDRIEPTGPVDAARGLITGTASPESKQR